MTLVIWAVVACTVLLAFCFGAYSYGYRAGARKVIAHWEDTLKRGRDTDGD